MDTLLALDQGTTSTRAFLFDKHGNPLDHARREVQSFFPHPGWVEQDPELIWQGCVEVVKEVIEHTKSSMSIKALGITNQRETTILWDKQTGKAIYPAIVWQDRRTQDLCQQWIDQGLDAKIQQKTGLVIDPFFSASKIVWILDHIPHARTRAEQGEILFGTIDTYLIWRLTQGKVHASDMTNASRTLLFNLHTRTWDEDLCQSLNVPMAVLPEVKECADDFGVTQKEVLGRSIPIRGVAGDQQAASLGQACLKRGDLKSTYGTGCFMLMNTQDEIKVSDHRLISTLAYQINKKPCYALEGSLFMAGSIMQWLRDELNMLVDVAHSSQIARGREPSEVILVPAFTGLGAPFWDPKAKGAILNLSRNTHKDDIIRAALEAVCFQTKSLLEAFEQDAGHSISQCKIDGGMAENEWMLEYLSHTLKTTVTRPKFLESTALGAAFLAGLGVGLFSNLEEIEQFWQPLRCYEPDPRMALEIEQKYKLWQQALSMISPQASKWYQSKQKEVKV